LTRYAARTCPEVRLTNGGSQDSEDLEEAQPKRRTKKAAARTSPSPPPAPARKGKASKATTGRTSKARSSAPTGGLYKFSSKGDALSGGRNTGFEPPVPYHDDRPEIPKPQGEAGRKSKDGKIGYDARKKIRVPTYVWNAMRVSPTPSFTSPTNLCCSDGAASSSSNAILTSRRVSAASGTARWPCSARR
jgi:hypothetical protein